MSIEYKHIRYSNIYDFTFGIKNSLKNNHSYLFQRTSVFNTIIVAFSNDNIMYQHKINAQKFKDTVSELNFNNIWMTDSFIIWVKDNIEYLDKLEKLKVFL